MAYKKSWNNLKENNFESEDDFIKRFENIINSTIKTKKNIEKIPIIKFCFKNNFVEYWIFDGFHRVTTCLYHNINFDIVIKKVINLKNTYPLEKNQWWKNYWYPLNINFFQNKNSQNYEVLDSKYIDYIIYYYLKNIIKNFLVIVSYEGNISEHLKDFNILFSKKITSKSNKFKKNFIELLYYNDEWPIKCYVEKSKNCFKSDNLIIYFIENMDISILKKKKEYIRNIFNREHHSIHSTDNSEESNDLIGILNFNTIKFLNNTETLFNKFYFFNKLFKMLKKFCKDNKISIDKICIIGSSVLSLYNLRDSKSMDLFIDKSYEEVFKNSNFKIYNSLTFDNQFNFTFEDIIFNPENYFIFQNFKFCNLDIIKYNKEYCLKNNISNIKSKNDLKLINNINYNE